MVSKKLTSPLEELHLIMTKRLLFSSIVATQFIAFSAVGRDDAFRCQDLSSGNRSVASAAQSRADDPVPCPDCNPPGLAAADDPVPCPDCNPPGLAVADDPVPCPDCNPWTRH